MDSTTCKLFFIFNGSPQAKHPFPNGKATKNLSQLFKKNLFFTEHDKGRILKPVKLAIFIIAEFIYFTNYFIFF